MAISPQPTTRAPLSLGRKLLFAAILSTVAFALLLCALELTLRLTGYGHSTHFVRREKLPDGSVILRENRDCTAPFFSEKLVRRPQPFRLSEHKKPGAIRIVILGSSAAMGDPEASFSIARLLEARLRSAYPDKAFEVVNAAITAINSHVVRGIADDCARDLQPDLFIVYEGHNEVIGPFGPTGVFTGFLRSERAVRIAIWLKSTRTGQLIASLARPSSSPEKWGGMEMFLAQKIPSDDPRLDTVRAHFAANLRAIAASADHAGATTLLCTTLANQRDFAPFLSLHRPDLTATQLAEWEKYYAIANEAALLKHTGRAEAAYRAAFEIDDRYAELSFRLARLLLPTGQHADVPALLQRALDLDALRFRADSSLNAIIRTLPASLPESRVRIVDLTSPLAAPARQGPYIGNSHLYEHVHLTFLGTHSVVEELFPAVVSELQARELLSSGPVNLPFDYGELRRRLAFTAYEQALIFAELQNRYQRPPFTAQSDHALRLETTAKQLASAQALLARPDATTALRASYDYAIASAPEDWILHRNTGMMLLARGEPAAALPYLEKAAAFIDDDIDTLLALANAHKTLGHPADADRLFARIRLLEPRHPSLP